MHERRFHGDIDRLRSPERLARLEVERVVALSREGLAVETMLDIGTGTGIFADAFSKVGIDVTGIDGSAEMINFARRYVPEGLFALGEAEQLPFEDRSFDLVFLGHLLHEADNPAGALAEARRVSRLRVVVIEWPYCEEEHGPPLAHRLEPKAILEMSTRAGLRRHERIALAHMDLYRLEPS